MEHPLSIFLFMAPCRRLQFNLSDLYPVPRLGIGYLSAWLKAHGFPNVVTRDLIAEREWIPELLARFERDGAPDVLGIGVTILSLREAFEVARAVKARHPATRVIVGGPGAGFRAAALLEHGEAVDAFVRGEGEGPMLAFCRAVAAGRDDWSDVPALVWRKDGVPTENPPGPYRNLGDGIMVDYDGQPLPKYRLHPPMGIYPPATMMETVRGCSFPCEFCCLSMPVRAMPPALVVEQARWLIERHGIREIHFVDPTFTLNRARALELCERLEPLGIHWTCKTRTDLVDEEMAAAMARSGCYHIAFGVESGDDLMLANVQKKATAQGALETFARCRRHRIRTSAYLLVANPGETEATTQHTIDWVRQLDPDYVLYDILMPDPYNPLTRRQIEAGVFTHEDLERYYLTDLPSRLHEITVTGLPWETAKGWLKRSAGDFYVRPKYMWQRIRDLRTLQDALNLGAGGTAFFKDMLGLGRLWRYVR
jgi:radical SAM superfamily enzyme YgiQ (UPF0313 family)